MDDPRSIAAIDIAEKYAHGNATGFELAAARAAARAAAWTAAWAAASDAASDAAWAAARAAQSKRLLEICATTTTQGETQ